MRQLAIDLSERESVRAGERESERENTLMGCRCTPSGSSIEKNAGGIVFRTCDLVSMHCNGWLVSVFQNLIF